MEDETLFDKAEQNYKVAESIRKNLGNDEAYLNYVGYHLQQSVELAIKHMLEINGVEYPKIHDVTQLIALAGEQEIDWHYNEYIDEHSEMFSMWESKTRYIKNYRLELRKIDKALEEVGVYLRELYPILNPEKNKREDSSDKGVDYRH